MFHSTSGDSHFSFESSSGAHLNIMKPKVLAVQKITLIVERASPNQQEVGTDAGHAYVLTLDKLVENQSNSMFCLYTLKPTGIKNAMYR